MDKDQPTTAPAADAAATSTTPVPADAVGAATAAPKKSTRTRRAGTRSAAAESAPAPAAPVATPNDADAAGTPAKAPAKRAPRRRATAAVASPAPVASADTATDTPVQTEPVATKPATRTTRRRATAVAEPVAEAPAEAPAGASPAENSAAATLPVEKVIESVDETPAKAPAKRAPRRRATSAVATAAVESPTAGAPETAEVPAAKAPVKRTTRRRATATATADATGASAASAEVQTPAPTALADAGAEAAEAPAKPARKAPARRRKQAAEAQEEVRDTAAPLVTSGDGPTGEPVTGEPAIGEPATEGATAQATTQASTDAMPAAEALFQAPAAGISVLFQAPDLSLAVPVPAVSGGEETGAEETEAEDETAEGGRRRRGRNRGRRSRPAGGDEADGDAEPTGDGEANATDNDGVTSRRRRRRRRGEADLELTGGTDEDPPNTVTKVRAPRTPADSSLIASNRVTSLRGSTRLEAKKQRRRDSRDSGRRRTVITEAEFLARRESVDRVMVVRQRDNRIQIGVLEDGVLAEHFVSKTQQDSLIGNVYLGKVQNVLPSMEAAFVDIGRGRNAVLYAGEVNWDAAKLNGQPRRIENALKSGDTVLVQVTKDPVGHKGARLTSQVSLPGRYLVYVPGGSMTGISRKLPDVERNRLKRVLKDHLPQDAGVIVRTAAEGASEEELTNDINRLRAQWEGINSRATSTKTLAPEMLYGEPDLTIKVVRDVFNEDFSKLIVSGDEAWDTIEAYVTYVAPDLLDRLEKWTKDEDIFASHRIDEQIAKALERKVFLPSGGSLVIDRTEAMTVVDVNTGKFTGSGGNLEETVTKNNLEAAEEVVRQLRLRDIGGIIVIDFIDMVLESNRDLVLRRLVECLGRDRTKHQVAEVTSLGLIQMTRKRMGTGLLEVFGEQCETCAGRGVVTQDVPVEHRRANTVAADAHHAQVRHDGHRDNERPANRSTRSERKRNRNARNQNAAEETAVASTVQPASIDEGSAEKASAARAAFANIAAAAAAAHHDPDHHDADQHDSGRHGTAPAPDAAEPVVEVPPVQPLPTTLGDLATLSLGGERIELPRGHQHESAATLDKAAVLADLTQALDQLAGAPGHGDEQASADSSRSRSRHGRRNRSARSAQGGADTAVEVGADGGRGPARGTAQPSVQHSSAAPTPAAVRKPAADAPIILGVGVPAADL
ncbi:Rne/Rng family ribonuclease [Specibacter cremeus]|uniref:Rne/Rng family ribonuclease n=1 Tax=Specibacter cremeus TaxID=1629051 RepID=UPI000F7AF429|nr:Rne/Rng family ribonuclease [Specibacter cremeus]